MKNFKLHPCGINDAKLFVTSYYQGSLQGWFSHPRLQTPRKIDNVPQLIFLLDELQAKENAYHSFPEEYSRPVFDSETIAILRIQVLFQDHHTWQGTITWEDNQVSTPFHSVLEMIQIIDEILAE